MRTSKKRTLELPAEGKPSPEAGSFFYRVYDGQAAESKDDASRLRLDQFRNPFDLDAMHPSQREYFRFIHKLRDIANDPAKLADFYADLIATAHRDFHFNSPEKTRTGIDMYSASLQDLGFTRRPRKELTQHISHEKQNVKVIVVVGCQDISLLEARAKAAAHVFKCCMDGACDDIAILFSGRHPPEDRVTILNEAANLKESFESFISTLEDRRYADKYYEFLASTKVRLETESENTGENIAKLDLFIVSNDFHLVRLSKSVRAIQYEKKGKGRALATLNLIGAEGFVPENVSKSLESREYSKRFYFEALSDFFRRNHFLDDRIFLKQLDKSFEFLGETLPVAFFPFSPFAKKPSDTPKIHLRLNEAVLFPIDKLNFSEWVTDFFRRRRPADPDTVARMQLLQHMGGRHTQPTVRFAGEVKADQSRKGEIDITLASNFDGVSHATQFGLLSVVNPELKELATRYNLLSLQVMASYLFEIGGKQMLLFHRRGPSKYTFPSCWDCAVEGPIYKDDLRGKATLDPKAAAERLFEKQHIESVEITPGAPPSYEFTVFAISFDRLAGQCSVQGVLKGPSVAGATSVRAINDLVDSDATCRATPDEIAALLSTSNHKWNPSALYNILFTLEYLGYSQETVSNAFRDAGILLSGLRGDLIAESRSRPRSKRRRPKS
jgi:hypothetical protein